MGFVVIDPDFGCFEKFHGIPPLVWVAYRMRQQSNWEKQKKRVKEGNGGDLDQPWTLLYYTKNEKAGGVRC
jgi:hypothetical protein